MASKETYIAPSLISVQRRSIVLPASYTGVEKNGFYLYEISPGDVVMVALAELINHAANRRNPIQVAMTTRPRS